MLHVLLITVKGGIHIEYDNALSFSEPIVFDISYTHFHPCSAVRRKYYARSDVIATQVLDSTTAPRDYHWLGGEHTS